MISLRTGGLSFIKNTLQEIGTTIVDEKVFKKIRRYLTDAKYKYRNREHPTDIRNELRELIALCDEFSNGRRNCSQKEMAEIKMIKRHLEAISTELSKKFGRP